MFGWILGIVGALGFAGSIALAVFAPALASQLLTALLDVLARIWKTRTGCIGMTAAACLLFGYFYFDAVGASRVKAEWDAANASAAVKAHAADANAAANAARMDQKNTAAEAADDKAAREARDAYIAELEKRAASVCVDTDADIRRLLNDR